MNTEFIAAYEQILLGNRRSYPTDYFTQTETINKKNAIDIYKYAFEVLLGWKPEDVATAINIHIINSMHLKGLFKYLDIPVEYNNHVDPKYFAALLYPERYQFNREKLDLDIYKSVLKGRMSSYPKKFFQGEDGRIRACICMSYALRNNMHFRNIQEIYATFSEKKGLKLIKENKLTLALDGFETPVDFIHDSLSPSQKDDFFYYYYKFLYLFRLECSKNKVEQGD